MNLNKNVGSSKIYTCPVCKFIIDRDINSARNIFLKWLAYRSYTGELHSSLIEEYIIISFHIRFYTIFSSEL